MALRPLNQIAASILTAWGPTCRNTLTNRPYQTFNLPYVDAMLTLRTIKESFGLDDGEDIVIRFLHNAASWRGDTARSIKAELNEHLKQLQS